MLTVQALSSFTLKLGISELPPCRPGDILVLDDAVAEGLIAKRLARRMPPDPTPEVPDGPGQDVSAAKPRSRANGRKKAHEGSPALIPEADGEQG